MKRWLVLLLLTLPFYAGAEGLRDKSFDLSLSIAAAFPGIIQASFEKDYPPDKSVLFRNAISPGLKLVAEYYPRPIPWLAPSVAFHYAPLFLPEEIDLGHWGGTDHIIPKNDIHFVEVEAGIKFRSFFEETWTVEPGLYLGYCHTFSSSPDAVNNGLILDVNTEIQRHYRWFHLVFTLGFMAQLYGGVEDLAYIRSLPVVYLAAGMGI
jgi:hypothetical protein